MDLLDWRKPSRCEAGHCIEVTARGPVVLIRDSHNPSVHITVAKADLSAFIESAKEGHYDDLCEW